MTSSSNTKPPCARTPAARCIDRAPTSQTYMAASSIRHERKMIAVSLCARGLYSQGAIHRRFVLDHLAPSCILPYSDLVGHPLQDRSEERRVGKECVSTCRSRWSRYP